MNLGMSKCSHKAQILESDESLAEDVFFSSDCTRCPDTFCRHCARAPVCRQAERGPAGRQLVPLCKWVALPCPQGRAALLLTSDPQAHLPACRAWAVSARGLCHAAPAPPRTASPKGALVWMESSADVAAALCMVMGAPGPVWTLLQHPSLALED